MKLYELDVSWAATARELAALRWGDVDVVRGTLRGRT